MEQSNHWRRYLAVGVLSVLKALVVRRNRRRFRTELTDAGLFLGLAALVRYVEGGSQSRSERPWWVEEATQRLGTKDGGSPIGRIDELLEQRDLRKLYRQEVSPRLSGEEGENEQSTLRERIRMR